MKFRSWDDDYDERSKKNNIRYVKNQNVKELSQQEITAEAEKLLDKSIDNRNIFGYIRKNNNNLEYCKWNINNEVFVSYIIKNNKKDILQSKLKSFREYNGDKVIEYHDEIE